jgi:hypothetical protein
MIVQVRVQSERPDEYVGKRGPVKQQVATCQDIETSGVRLVQMFDYFLSDDEKVKYAGKLLDREMKLGVTEISQFGSRLRVRGKIMEVPSLDAKPAVK